MEENLAPKNIANSNVEDLLKNKIKNTNDVKEAIDLAATISALSQDSLAENTVLEKSIEIKNNAETKRLIAETERILQEKEKEVAEKERQSAECDRIIALKEQEIEALKKECDKAETYFAQNKEILKCIGVRSCKSLNVMKFWLYPASLVYGIIQILLFPITLCGIILESMIDIVGGICGEIKNHALKIVMAIIIIVIVIGIVALVYIAGGKALEFI